MKVTRRPEPDPPRGKSPRISEETIVAAWQALERESAGADELVSIQQTLDDDTISPAEIARALAKGGVELRHHETIICDARWREAHFEREARTFAGVSALRGAVPLELKDAEAALAELERLRNTFAVARDNIALHELKALAVESRETAIRRTHDS